MTTGIYGTSIYGNVYGKAWQTGSSYYSNSATSGQYYTNAMNVRVENEADIDYIKYCLEKGDIDKATNLYSKFLESVENEYAGSGLNAASIASKAFKQYAGCNFSTQAMKGANNSFVTGFLESIPLFGLLANSSSEEEIYAMSNGRAVDKKEAMFEKAGIATSALAVGAVAACIPGVNLGVAIAAGAFALIQGVAKNSLSKIA